MVRYLNENLLFECLHHDAGDCTVTVTVKSALVDSLYQHVLHDQRKRLQAEGFSRGGVPVSYIESTCKQGFLDHLKEFFFNHSIITFLCEELYANKIVVAGEPTLTSIAVDPTNDASFVFTLKALTPDVKNEWKKFPYKAPGRKNYKDLDRQVETFLHEEEIKRKAYDPHLGIQRSDWVSCLVGISACSAGGPLLTSYKSPLWLKIGREEQDQEAQALFVGKKVGDSFTTESNFFQQYFSKKLDTTYVFDITIVDHVPSGNFSLDLFKHHFKLKTAKELHQKFIEIFSFRNDISQRREIVDSALRTLIKNCHFTLPEPLVTQQEQVILKALRKNPDYPVYKAQEDFRRKITLLAEKQLKETILVDHIAHQEQVALTPEDIRAYLTLLIRPRTREFIHFNLPPTQLSGQEQPIPAGIIHQACVREKTLNYTIQRLIHG